MTNPNYLILPSRFGFAETARRRLYYGSEDALIFQAALPAAVPPNGAEPC